MWLRLLVGGAVVLVFGVIVTAADYWLFHIQIPWYCWVAVGLFSGFSLRTATGDQATVLPPRIVATVCVLIALPLGTYIGLAGDYAAVRTAILDRVSEQSARIAVARELESQATAASPVTPPATISVGPNPTNTPLAPPTKSFPGAILWRPESFCDPSATKFPPSRSGVSLHDGQLFAEEFESISTKQQANAAWSQLPPEEQKQRVAEMRRAIEVYISSQSGVVFRQLKAKFASFLGLIALGISAWLAYYLGVGGALLE